MEQLWKKEFPHCGAIVEFVEIPQLTHSFNKVWNTLISSCVRCHDSYSGGQGTTIPIDPVELINVVRYDLLSREAAPFGYFFRSRLNCKI